MTDTNQAEIYQLITDLRDRTGRHFEEVRGLMADYLGIFEYDRSLFDNKFRRRDRRQNFQLDEVLAIIYAFTVDLDAEQGCTAYEAMELCTLTNMGLNDYGRLREFFDEDDYRETWGQYLKAHELWPERPSRSIATADHYRIY